MDTRTRSASPTATVELQQESSPPAQDKISAYYSLVFPHFTFYIQTLSVTIGRRCAPNPNVASSSIAELVAVDVDLGALKSVSRLHAKIEYDRDEDRFVLAVIGRNGAWVDGVWSGSGTRAPLGERSQIQIASRIFHFVLPPPPPPEDTPSPSSQSSNNRPRSPSLDITSISPPSSQPSHTPPPPAKSQPLAPPPEPQIKCEPQQHKPLPAPTPQLPNSNAIGKPNKTANSKKRKKSDVESSAPPRPKPEDMPSKPPFTYAQLIYRAIKAIGDKATLQEICSWIMNTHEYYRYIDGGWMSSVRHNLSSSRAFLKLERCGGDRGKGFFWKLDELHSRTLEEQEARMLQAATAAGAHGSGKDGNGRGRKKDKGASFLEPPLKRSVMGDTKGGPLPPPLTSLPLAAKILSPDTTTPTQTTTTAHNISPATSKTSSTKAAPATTGVFAYPTHTHQTHMPAIQSSSVTLGYSGSPLSVPNPYAALTHWGLRPPQAANTSTVSIASMTPASTPASSSGPKIPEASSQFAHMQPYTTPVPDVVIPIVLGPIPPSHPDYSPTHPNNSAKEGYMVLHDRTLILDPDIFSGVTKDMLTELEKMGMRAALTVLTGHMVRALKERRAKGRGKAREKGIRRVRGKGKGKGKGSGIPTVEKPFTSVPLESRKPVSELDADTTVNVGANVVQAEPLVSAALPALDTISMDTYGGQEDVGSPIVVVDDSSDEGPTAKRRKVGDVIC